MRESKETSMFVLGEPVEFEESISCEFKEVKNQPPIQAIGKVIDEYVVAFLNSEGGSVYWGIRDNDRRVTGVRLSDKMRDELRQVAGQKIGAIAPPIAANTYELPFHKIVSPDDHKPVENVFVVEIAVHALSAPKLFLTGSGEAYRKTLGGTKKFTGAELFTALLMQLNSKAKKAIATDTDDAPQLAEMPSVESRAKVVKQLVQGSRILWVDDIPANNLYERTVLSSLGIATDLALSTEEAVYMSERLKYDLIISDMNRAGDPSAGLKMLDKLQKQGINSPVIYYVGTIRAEHGIPLQAFAITNRPDELLHYVFDVLERRHGDLRSLFHRTKPTS